MTIAGVVVAIALITPTAFAVANHVAAPNTSNPAGSSIYKGLPDSAYHNTWATLPNPPLPTSGPPDLCGPWSATDSPQVAEVRSAHGTLDSCQLIDHYWIVTTENPGDAAQIAVLNCDPSDSTCMNGWSTKSLTSFSWHVAPPAVAQMRIVLRSGHVLTMLTNDGEWSYDVDTTAFAPLGTLR